MVTQITQLPPAPSRKRPSEFSNEADAFIEQLPTFGNQANQLALEVNESAATVKEDANDARNAAFSANLYSQAAEAASASAAGHAADAASAANSAGTSVITATQAATTATTQADRAQDIVDSVSNITEGPVLSFNNRSGAVTLNSSDIFQAGAVMRDNISLFTGTSLMSSSPVGVWGYFEDSIKAGMDWPDTLVPASWVVFTYGKSQPPSKYVQIASQCSSLAPQLTYIRSFNGLTWSRWVAIGTKPVWYVTDTLGHMHGGTGEKALNALNVWTYQEQIKKFLPDAPRLGDTCTIIIDNGRTDNTLYQAPTGEPIMGLDYMTIDKANVTVTFVYVGGTYGWRII